MANKAVWDGFREFVRQQDLVPAVEALEAWLKGRLDGPEQAQVRDWLDELVLHVSSARAVKLDARKGLTTKEEVGVQVRQISKSILNLITEIERKDLESTVDASLSLELPSAFQKGNFEKIIGNKIKLQMVSWLERGLECSTAVCRLVCGEVLGTGFRVQKNLIVTNNHVIANRDEAKKFTAQFFYEERVDRTMRKIIVVPIDAGRFWTSRELDITLVGASVPSEGEAKLIHTLPLQRSSPVSIGDAVSIIQHPLGGPKQIALTANEVINVHGHRIQYVTDTLPGSSGAPVFNSAWDVVAVHHVGGQLLKNAAGDRVFANEGIDVASFLEVPEVQAMIATS